MIASDALSAAWTSDDGDYEARVHWTSHRDDRSATGWRWELFWPGGHCQADDGGLIFCPMTPDPVDVLATLASFLGAWREAIEYGVPTYGLSENADLFPFDALEFMPAIEEFEMWGYDHENPYDENEVG